MILGALGALTYVTGSFDTRANNPLSTASPTMRVSWAPISPSTHTSIVGEAHLLGTAETRDERAEQSAEPFGERKERAQRLVRLGDSEVDGERHELAGEGELDHLGDRVAGLVLRLPGARPEVGRHDDRVEAEQGRVGGRFGGEHVEGGAGDAFADRLGEADSSTIPPRATLTTRRPGLALSSRSRPISPRSLVSSADGS